jgi:hypothetical protein
VNVHVFSENNASETTETNT